MLCLHRVRFTMDLNSAIGNEDVIDNQKSLQGIRRFHYTNIFALQAGILR